MLGYNTSTTFGYSNENENENSENNLELIRRELASIVVESVLAGNVTEILDLSLRISDNPPRHSHTHTHTHTSHTQKHTHGAD